MSKPTFGKVDFSAPRDIWPNLHCTQQQGLWIEMFGKK